MERLMEGFSNLGWQQYLFAACMAYAIVYIINLIGMWKKRPKNDEKTFVIKTVEKHAYDRCAELFPIDVLTFKGREFKRGMQIKVTTIQKNIIVGEFIGLNQLNLVCIKTGNQIIAHQLEKIEEVTVVE